MSRFRYIFRAFVSVVAGLVLFSCTGLVIGDVNDCVISDFPVNVNAGTVADTRISLDDLALSWEETDTLSICAVASNGTYANSELAVHEIDPSDRSRASFALKPTADTMAHALCVIE